MLKLTPRSVAGSHRAKYLQLADAIRAAIADGYLEPAENLPSEASIAGMAGVSKSVVREAFKVLEGEGSLELRNGVPARVPAISHVREISDQRYRDENRNIRDGVRADESAFTRGHGIAWSDFQVEVEVNREVATPKDRELLHLPTDPDVAAYVWRLSFLKYADGIPVEIQRSALPDFVVDGNPWLIDPARQPAPGGTQRDLADAGFRPTRVSTRGKPRMPTEDERRDLRIAQVPVLDLQRVFWSGRRPVEASRLVLPGASHEIVYETLLRD